MNDITPKSFLDQAQEFQAEIWGNDQLRTQLQAMGIMDKVDSMCAYVQQLSKDIPRTAIPEPACPLYAVKDHEEHIVHTTVSTEPQDCIDDWMETEACFRQLANISRQMKGLPLLHEQAWETYEAQGYSVVRVEIVEQE